MNYQEELERRGIETSDGAGPDDVLILCPFHSDTRPSCEVHVSRGVFYCFSCGAKGSFVKLIAEIEGITVPQAKRSLMSKSHYLDLLENIQSILDAHQEVEQIKMFSVKSFHEFFPEVRVSKEAMDYLLSDKRKLLPKWTQAYDLRWGEEGVMKDRVVIPVYTASGGLLTYAGRAIDSKMQPKTRKVRSGLSTLFGLFQAINQYGVSNARKLPYLIVVEGEFDAIYLNQHGYPAVAAMGTADITEQQMGLLKKYTQTVVWSYDGDEAGKKAQNKAFNFSRRYMPTVEVKLMEGYDPNMLSKYQLDKIYGGYV